MDIEKQFDEFFESTTVAGILEVTPLVKKDGRISKFMLVVRYIPKSWSYDFVYQMQKESKGKRKKSMPKVYK